MNGEYNALLQDDEGEARLSEYPDAKDGIALKCAQDTIKEIEETE